MAEPLLELRDVSVRRGDVTMLAGVSLVIPRGRHTAVLGPNGAGKTSLVRLLDRQLYPSVDDDGTQGGVRILGRSAWDVAVLRRRMGIVSAGLDREFSGGQTGRMTVTEAVASGFTATELADWGPPITADVREAAEAALARVDATRLAARHVDTLSTGERRRVLIARALVHAPEILVLDEPTTGLDIAARHAFLDILTGLCRQPGLTVVLVTHHLEEIVPEFRHAVLLAGGRIVCDGPVAEALHAARLSAVFGVPLEVSRDAHGRLATRVVRAPD
jgi:iron complex transport system ATP-binding protein